MGLAAAAHLVERKLPFLVFEAGPRVGHSALAWGHVQLFSPRQYCVDPAAARLLATTGWQMPDPESYPNGRALVEQYLAPLAAHEAIAAVVQLIRGWRTGRLERTPDGIVAFAGEQALAPVDESIVATGLRPNLARL